MAAPLVSQSYPAVNRHLPPFLPGEARGKNDNPPTQNTISNDANQDLLAPWFAVKLGFCSFSGIGVGQAGARHIAVMRTLPANCPAVGSACKSRARP